MAKVRELQGQPCGGVRGPLTKSISDGPGIAVGVWGGCQPSQLLPGTSFLLKEKIQEDLDRRDYPRYLDLDSRLSRLVILDYENLGFLSPQNADRWSLAAISEIFVEFL